MSFPNRTPLTAIARILCVVEAESPCYNLIDVRDHTSPITFC